MSAKNVELIRALYDSFSAGDIQSVLGCMSPDIVWIEAENNPYADGNPYIGPKAVLDGVFARCAGEWDGFSVQVEELIDAGDTVVMRGRYRGVYKATGIEQNTEVAHVWRLADGKATGFHQHLDTLAFQRVMGAV